MALMTFREANHVLWQGVRPAHDGTQIAKNATITDGVVTIHDVTVGKTFFLTDWVFHINASAVPHFGSLYIATPVPVTVFTISFIRLDAIGQQTLSCAYFYPIEIPATYLIRIASSDAAADVSGFVHGWEE